MRVRTEIEVKDAEKVHKAVLPEIKFGKRAKAVLKVKNQNILELQIEAQDLTALKASLNSFIRIIILAEEVGGI